MNGNIIASSTIDRSIATGDSDRSIFFNLWGHTAKKKITRRKKVVLNHRRQREEKKETEPAEEEEKKFSESKM